MNLYSMVPWKSCNENTEHFCQMKQNLITTLLYKSIWTKFQLIKVSSPTFLLWMILVEPLMPESREAFLQSLALLKRNAVAAPFERAFNTQKELEVSGGQGQLMQVHYRDEEAIFIQAAPDRVTVIFSTVFREETDRIFGK